MIKKATILFSHKHHLHHFWFVNVDAKVCIQDVHNIKLIWTSELVRERMIAPLNHYVMTKQFYFIAQSVFWTIAWIFVILDCLP